MPHQPDPGPADPSPTETAHALRDEQLRLHRRILGSSAAASALMGTVLTLVHARLASGPGGGGWWLVLMAALAGRVAVGLAHGRTAQRCEPARWLPAYRASIAAHGLAWGLASLWLFSAGDAPQQAFLTLVVALVAAAGITTAAFDMVAMALFVAPAVAPLLWRLLRQDGELDSATAFTVLLFVAVVGLGGWRTHQRFREGLRLRADEAARSAALRLSEQRLTRTLNATGDAMFAYDADRPDGPLLFANDQFYALWNLPKPTHTSPSRNEILAAASRLFVDPDAEARRIDAITAMRVPHEDQLRLNDGRVLWRRSVPMADGVQAARVWSFRDITTETRAVQALQRAEAEQRALLAAFPGYIAAIDQDFRYTYVNERLAALVGGTPAQIVGRHAREVLGEARFEAVRAEVERALGGAFVQSQRRYEATGSRPRLDLQVTHVRGARLGPAASTCYAFGEDITALKQAQEALRVAKDEADRANQAKSQFLSSMSHELRTPLNAILGFGQLLLADSDTPLTPRQHHQVGEILRGGSHLLNLINEVLDLARIEAGRFPISLEPVAVHTLMADCASLVAPVARDHGVDLVLRPFDPALAVQADRTRLKQVLLNLLANAIKYNRPQGQVRLACHTEGDRLRLEVSDDGPGLDAEQQRRLFQAFERLNADQAGAAGTGIGLALSRHLVEAMHGHIGVHSVAGQGCTFWLSLPRADLAAAARVPVAPIASAGEAAADPAHVLYIEDNPVNVLLMEAMLAHLPNVRLTSAPLPGPGLDIARAERPDLVLLDIQLPGMDGHEVLRRLRAMAETRDIPVIAVSANAMGADIAQARAAGFSDYLTKPLDMLQLLARVRATLAARRNGSA